MRNQLGDEAADRAKTEYWAWLSEISTVHEGRWDPAKHPRRGTPPNPGWFASKGSTYGSADGTSFFDAVVQRNLTIGELTGGPTPGMIASSRLAVELQSAGELVDDVARAAAAGLGTGGKAVVNGTATAIKNVVTLGLSGGQLELIGVTQEDRERGYDTAVAISTASGQVLIAVGTGGLASALSKGGTVAQAASGALIAYDAAGNAVGVVQGALDASKNGVNLTNGTQITAGLLGLAANAAALKALKSKVAIDSQLNEIHGSLDTIAQARRTTAIVETADGNRIVASGGRDLTPVQRSLLREGDVAAKLPGAHAEITALEHASRNGMRPAEIVSTRPFCDECVKVIKAMGGSITSPTTAVFPRK